MRFKKIAVFIGVFFLFGLNLHSQEEPVGKVDFMVGKATVTTKDKKTRTLKKGYIFYGGESVATASGATVKIVLKNKSVVKVMPNSNIIINDVKFGKESDRYAFGVVKGGMSSKVSKLGQKDYYKVYGPTSVAGVRGTEFLVAVGVNGNTDVMVKEGAVSLEGEQKREAVKAGEKVEVSLTEEPKKEAVKEENLDKEFNSFVEKNEKVENPGETVGTANAKLEQIEVNNAQKIADLKKKEKLSEEEQDELDFLYQRSVNQSRSLYYLSESIFKKNKSNTLVKRNFYQVQKRLSSIEEQIADMDEFIEKVSKEIEDFTQDVSEDIDNMEENFLNKKNK